MPQSQRSSRRYKIEPLNYQEAALSPALKGMTSFLDVRPEDVRSGNFDSFGPALEVITSPDVVSGPELLSSPEYVSPPGDETTPAREPSPLNFLGARGAGVVTPIFDNPSPVKTPAGRTSPATRRTPKSISYPGDETLAVVNGTVWSGSSLTRLEGITPGRGRSKVRRAVLAQDGHSLGEEAIYQVMWRGGRPESGDPNSSRTIRIGAADIGYKVNMAKKNVRQNVSRLFEKLAVEILEDFETMSSQARLYKVYSYKQILDRRRAAGLEYVLRNKGVVFCTPSGEELVLSPAYVPTPGDETSIRPAPPKRRRPGLPSSIEQFQQPITPAPSRGEDSESEELQIVSQALNRYWPVDQPAAVQLLRNCRRVRADARPEEIAFFVREKLELTRQTRNITNPTGLILATVPQSFIGSTFEEFRKRMERQAALAAEEKQRKEQQHAELLKWFQAERDKCETIAGDASLPQKERDAAERLLRQLGSRKT